MMKVDERRNQIIKMLLSSDKALSGSYLSECLAVSRQIIVCDISYLKKSGYNIISTHLGYIINDTDKPMRVFKVCHTTDQTEDELNSIVDLGGSICDVYVWHKAYGKITAKLNIFSRLHVKQFINSVRSGKSTELMHITGGYHYHTVKADSEDILDLIEAALEKYIVPEI